MNSTDQPGPNTPDSEGTSREPLQPAPPVISQPPLGHNNPTPPPINPRREGSAFLPVLLSVCLAAFLADGVVSFADDSLSLSLHLHALGRLRGLFSSLALLTSLLVYIGMAFTTKIPKRLFVPLTLFNLVAPLAVIPFLIYSPNYIQQVAWVISSCQVVLGLLILRATQGRFECKWPLVTEQLIVGGAFTWRNLSLFLAGTGLVLIPLVIVYLVGCAAVAIDHYTEGFLVLRPAGLIVQMREYVRDDGKSIQLYPMAHIGNADFYNKLSETFATNSIVLMEGVSDDQNLLTNKITYAQMATKLGLAEQQKEFHPQGTMVRADIDVSEFSAETIKLLNMIMFVHAKGFTIENLLKLSEYTPPPNFQKQLTADLIGKRNQHLLKEIQSRLAEPEPLIIPWGVAHMPGIAKQIQNWGFRPKNTQQYVVISFGAEATTAGRDSIHRQ